MLYASAVFADCPESSEAVIGVRQTNRVVHEEPQMSGSDWYIPTCAPVCCRSQTKQLEYSVPVSHSIGSKETGNSKARQARIEFALPSFFLHAEPGRS